MDALVALWNMESSAEEKVLPCEHCCSVFRGHWVLRDLQGRVTLLKSLQRMWSDVEKSKPGILI